MRFVAATHRPLEEMVAKGEFREDLFYRLNVVPMWLPPLRARPEDIEPLARHFLRACTPRPMGGRRFTLTAGRARSCSQAQPWPGNVRQLQNFIERLVVLSDGPGAHAARTCARELARQPGLMPTAFQAPAASPGLRRVRWRVPTGSEPKTLESQRRDTERQALVDALKRAGDNRTLAARLLGISRRTLYNKLEEHGLV